MNTQQARARVADTHPQPVNRAKFMEFKLEQETEGLLTETTKGVKT